MTTRDDRSMNEQLQRGMLDGKIKNMRPDSADADYSSAVQRARQLHPMNYGTFGQGSDDMTPFLEEFLEDSAARRAARDQGLRGY